MDDNFDAFDDMFDDPEFKDAMKIFHDKLEDNAMREAYRFIEEVGILFWIRRDMYVANNRKTNILNKMIEYFKDPSREEYEKCAYLMKGMEALNDSKKSKDETSAE